MDSASSIARTLGRMVSVANLRMESAIRVSVSERCVMGVGGIEEMSRGSARRGCGVVVRVRRLDDTQHLPPSMYSMTSKGLEYH